MMFILKVVFAGFLMNPTAAASPQNQIKSFRVAIIDIAPNGWLHNGKPQGAYVDIASYIARESNLSPKFILTSRTRATEMILSGEVDGTIMYPIVGSRYRLLKRVHLFNRDTAILTRKDTVLRPLETYKGLLAGLNGRCPGLPKNSTATIMNINHHERGLNLVEKKRVSGVCGSYLTLLYWLKKSHKNPELFQLHRTMGVDAQMILHSKFSDKKIENFNLIAEKMRSDGVFDEIMMKYSPEP